MENYVLDPEMIGEGSFGKVYRAQRKDNGWIVALKKVHKMGRSERDIAGFRQECEIQRKLNHPNIIRMLDSFEAPESFVIVTEYAARGELSNLLIGRSRGLSISVVRRIACDLVSALYYLHCSRILHRDMKPQNILIGSDGFYKLCDFGFARIMSVTEYLLTSMKGTPLYMAPEIMDQRPYDHNADLWSLGCILYQLLMLKPPFFTQSIFQLAHMIQRVPVLYPNTIERDCKSFLEGLLEKKPQKRLTWPHLLNHPFIRDEIRIVNSAEEYSLTNALSPSQEFAKESERQVLLQKFAGLSRKLMKTAKKYEEAQKQLKKYGNSGSKFPTQKTPSPSKQHTTPPDPEKCLDATTTTAPMAKDITSGVTTLIKNLKVDVGVNHQQEQEASDDSSCETLTSSSEEESDADEDGRTVIIGRSKGSETEHNDFKDNEHGSIGDLETADPDASTSAEKVQELAMKVNNLWKSGGADAIFTLHSLGSDDKPIQSDEWIYFLIKEMKEVYENPERLCEKLFLSVIIAPLRNHLAGPEVLEKIADLLSVPFTMEEEVQQKIMFDLQSIYSDSKVLPNLLYALKLIVRRRIQEKNSVGLEEIAEILTVDDVAALNKCLRLVCFLVYLDEHFVVQLCDSVCVLQLFPILLLFLKLDKRNVILTTDTLAILCQIMRIIPSNATIVEELFLGNDTIRQNQDEFWRILKHHNPRVKSRAIRVLAYLSLNSEKTRDNFIKSNCVKIWKLLTDCVASEQKEAKSAAKFAFENIEMLAGSAPEILPEDTEIEETLRKSTIDQQNQENHVQADVHSFQSQSR